jgi:hypothetical protein
MIGIIPQHRVTIDFIKRELRSNGTGSRHRTGFLCLSKLREPTRHAAVCPHTDGIHPIPADVFVRLVLSPVRRAGAVVSRRSRYPIPHKT